MQKVFNDKILVLLPPFEFILTESVREQLQELAGEDRNIAPCPPLGLRAHPLARPADGICRRRGAISESAEGCRRIASKNLGEGLCMCVWGGCDRVCGGGRREVRGVQRLSAQCSGLGSSLSTYDLTF